MLIEIVWIRRELLEGTYGVVTLTVGVTVESLSFLTCVGFAVATSTMVGQNLGAGNLKRAEESIWLATLLCSLLLCVTTILFLLFSDFIARIFTTDELLIKYISDYLKIVSISQIFTGITITISGAFSGAGNTLVPMVISISTALLRLPLAYILAIRFDMGINGIWLVTSGTAIVQGIIILILFKQGMWKKGWEKNSLKF